MSRRAYRPGGIGPARCDLPWRPTWRKWAGIFYGIGPQVPINFESRRFKFWCWRCRHVWSKPWGQVLLVPYHVVAGLFYEYKPREILAFVKRMMREGPNP